MGEDETINETMTDEQRRELETAVLLGGKDVLITFKLPKDGAAVPPPETVRVRVLDDIPEFLEFIKVTDDPEALAEWILGKEKGWARCVRVESLLDIQKTALDLNFRTALRLAVQQGRVHERLIGALPQNERQRALAELRHNAGSSSTDPRGK